MGFDHARRAAAIIAGLCLASTAAAETFTLRVGAGHPPALPYIEQLSEFLLPEFAERVAARTDHDVRFVEAYGGSVAKLPEVLEAVEAGLLDIGAMSTGFEPSKLFLVNFGFHVPFASSNPVQSAAIARGLYESFEPLPQTHEAHNQRVLAILATSDYNIITTADWETLDDLEGRKILAAGPNLPWLTGTGAVPAQGSLAEAYNSLQTGVIDGMLAIVQAAKNFKLYEVAPHYTVVGFGSMPTNAVTVNRETWERLPPEVRDVLQEVALEYEARVNAIHRDLDARALEEMAAEGADVAQASPELRRSWAEALKGLPEAAAAEGDASGVEMRELLKRYLAALDEAGAAPPVEYVVN